MPAAPTIKSAELASLLRPALLRLTRLVRYERGDTSIPVGQVAALGSLFHAGPMSAGELADRERVQPPSMTKIVAALEERGLVTRTPHPTDGRQVVIAISERGRELVLETRRARTEWLARGLAQLTADERSTLRAAVPILEKLAER